MNRLSVVPSSFLLQLLRYPSNTVHWFFKVTYFSSFSSSKLDFYAWADGTVQWVMALAANLDNLSSISETHMVGETWLPQIGF